MTTFLFILVFVWLLYISARVRQIARSQSKVNHILAKGGDNLQSQIDLLREDMEPKTGRPLVRYGGKFLEENA